MSGGRKAIECDNTAVSRPETHQYQAVGGLGGQVEIGGVVGVEHLQRVSADLLVGVQQ